MNVVFQQFLAIDLGAESGRGVLSSFDGERISLSELGRFPTGRGADDLCPDGVQRWDFERIFAEIRALVDRARDEANGDLAGVGVDSWGVDFGLVDSSGALIESPVCYRDLSHPAAMTAAHARIAREEIWDATGIQHMSFNTLYQLVALRDRAPALLEKADRLLMMSDLLHAQLMGTKGAGVERTNGSTTQMMTPGAKAWNTQLLERLNLPHHFLPEIVDAGTRLGVTTNGIPVFTPPTHDTAAAVAAAPARTGTRWAFLSSGTWSLLGAELPAPIIDRRAMAAGFSNEGGVGGTTRFLKNIMGLWLVQQSRRSLARETGKEYSYPELVSLAVAAPEGGPLIDAVDERFLNPQDMALEIRSACRETGQPEPVDAGSLIRCCLESLALAYRRSLRDLGALLGSNFDVLHIIGGGSQNTLLNQWTADACGVTVLAGPSEATAVGNALGQLVGAGALSGWEQAREVSRRSFVPDVYKPNVAANERWADREEQILKIWRG